MPQLAAPCLPDCRPTLRRSRLSLGILVLLAPASLVAQKGWHVDSQFGFRAKVPAKWQRAAAEKDRRVVRGRYLSRRTYPVKGQRWDHMPEMRVVVISKADAARAKELAKDRGVQAWVPYYLDYSDYLTRNLSGELSVLSTDQGVAAGVPCSKFRIRRKTKGSPAYILQTWIFELEKTHVSIEFMVIEQHVSKLQKSINSAFAGFKVTKTDPKNDGGAFDLPLWMTDAERWHKLPARDRLERRSKFTEAFLAAVKADVTAGWRVQKTKHFFVLSRVPKRYTNDVAKAAELCRTWCDEQFGAVSDEMVMPAVIRIFESSTQRGRYRARSNTESPYVPEIREIVFTPRRDPARNSGALSLLHQGLLHQFLCDKDQHLYRHVPAWFRVGVFQYLRQTKLNRSKLEFIVNDTEKAVVREGTRAGNLGSIRALVQHDVPTVVDEEYRLRYQRGRLIRLAMDSKSPFEKRFLSEYLIGVRAAMKTLNVPVEQTGNGLVPGRSDQALEALVKTWTETRGKLRAAVNAEVCKFGDAGWQKVQAAYVAFNKRM